MSRKSVKEERAVTRMQAITLYERLQATTNPFSSCSLIHIRSSAESAYFPPDNNNNISIAKQQTWPILSYSNHEK